MPQEPTEEAAAQPDWLLVTNGRMPDWGPPYTETPANPYGPGAPLVAEPFNTVTATFFIWIALVWLWRLRGRYAQHPFVACCMPILLAGGIGGTLFHGTRAHVAYFLLDVVPIQLLGLAASLFMALRLWGRNVWLFLPGVGLFYFVVTKLFFRLAGPSSLQLSVNLTYAALAVVVLAPIALALWRTRFRHGGWVAAGLVSFGIAWVCRLVDHDIGPALPMGSHWLWHTFGAISTAMMIQFFYRMEGEAHQPHDERREDTIREEESEPG